MCRYAPRHILLITKMNVIMLVIIFVCRYAKCHYAECPRAKNGHAVVNLNFNAIFKCTLHCFKSSNFIYKFDHKLKRPVKECIRRQWLILQNAEI
jgi:hypothetical protein